MRRGREIQGTAMAVAAAVMALGAWAAWAGQAAPSRGGRGTKPGGAAAEVAMPFRTGEALDYRIAWATFPSAATLELGVRERRELYGWETWHFEAAFHTEKPVRTLFAIDDQFDSYTDASSLESRQFESYLDEMGKAQNSVWHLVATGQPPRAPGAAVVVLPGTRDPLGMLYTLRAQDWKRMPELRAPVYDGTSLWEMRAKEGSAAEAVTVDAGSYEASRIEIGVFQNERENASVHFTVWLANDGARTPVLIAAVMPFGSLRVELTGRKAGAAGGAEARAVRGRD